MMAVICPTVLAGSEQGYKEQMDAITPFAGRIQIDLMDGVFTPHTSVGLERIWWPAGVIADIHLMYAHPLAHVASITQLKPNLLIVHAEAEGSFLEVVDYLKPHGIKVGLALLKPTAVSVIEPVLDEVDHVLIFSGDLGSFGGHADMELLNKVHQLRRLKPKLEIGWDGGVNEHNIKQLADGGIDVLNVGGAIQRADNPQAAYARLKALIEEQHGD